MAKSPSPEERAHREREQKLTTFRAETEAIALRVARMRFGGRHTRNGHDPEDAVNEAYAYFDRRNYIETVDLAKQRALLLKIVNGKAVDMVKYEKRTDPFPEDHQDSAGADDPNLERVDEQATAVADLARAKDVLDGLTDRQRDILERIYVHDQSTADIAVDLGITDRGVRDQHTKAIERLRRKLDTPPTEQDTTTVPTAGEEGPDGQREHA